jgi:glycosyltransferase involved in cell wall biosynthesis
MSNTNEITISVVLPNYNDAKYITRAIESVINQTHKPLELIIIDDGSKDNSIEIINSYVQQYPFIKLHAHEHNLGTIKTMHESVHLVSGSHMAFIAADDWFLPDFLTEAYRVFKTNSELAFWSCASWSAYDQNPDALFATPMNYPKTQNGLLSKNQAAEMLYKIDSWFCGNTVVYNTKILRSEFGPNVCLDSFADNFLYRVLACKYGCGFTPKRLSVWRLRSGSMSNNTMKNTAKLQKIYTMALDMAENRYQGIFSDKILKRMRQRFMFDVLKSMWLSGDASLSLEVTNHIKKNSSSKFAYYFAISLLYAASKSIGKKALGLVVGYLYFRPYDVLNIVKIKTIQKYR